MASIGTIAPILDGRYRVEDCIGSGGMATVYRGWDDFLRRPVAIKVLAPGLAADPSFVERFKREASAAARVAHPNVVTVYNWGSCDGTYYIVMEYVDGCTLRDRLYPEGPLAETEALAIGAEIAAALEAIHAQGLIHRDIKPHNVLLAGDGRVKVTDFGIAYATGSQHLTQTNTVLGTAQYLAPEQILRQSVDQRTDCYSLGVVLYEMLVGQPPFAGDSPVAVALQHAYSRPPAPRERRADLSSEVEEIVLTALAKDPAERYQSAAAFKAAIEAVRALAISSGTLALPIPPPHAPPGIPADRIVSTPPAARHSLSPQARWFLAVPLLLLLVIGGGKALMRQPSGLALTDIRAASTASVVPSPSVAPTTAAPARGVSLLFPTAPAPTATPQPPPTATPAPATATATPVPPSPTPAQRVVVQAPRPQEAVLGFYYFVTGHQFDRAAALWTPQLQAQSPPAKAIDARYAQTTRITVQHWEVTAQNADKATVAIAVSEFTQGSDTPKNYAGTWQLVHTDVGWLLNAQDMHPA